MIQIWRPWKLSNFQDPHPLPIYVPNFSNPLTIDVQFLAPLPRPKDNLSIMIQGWLSYVINKSTTESFIIFSDYYWALPRTGHWPGYMWWLWLASHRLPHSLHSPYPQFLHWKWVEWQFSVELVTCALSHIQIHAYDVWSWHSSWLPSLYPLRLITPHFSLNPHRLKVDVICVLPLIEAITLSF